MKKFIWNAKENVSAIFFDTAAYSLAISRLPPYCVDKSLSLLLSLSMVGNTATIRPHY